MDVVAHLEERFGVPFPAGYREWSSKGYTDYRSADGFYLWVHEAE